MSDARSGSDVVIPKVLAIPSGAFGATVPTCPGTITLSGGVLYFMSGATLSYIMAVAA